LPYLPYVLGFAASSFIYIAVADLIPGMHRKVDANSSIKTKSVMTSALVNTSFNLIYLNVWQAQTIENTLKIPTLLIRLKTITEQSHANG